MADKTKTAKASSKPDTKKKGNKKSGGKSTKDKPSLGARIKEFFSSLFKEIKKIKWADGKTVLKNTLVVLLVVLVVGIGVWVADAILVQLRELLNKLATQDAETALIVFNGFLDSVSLL